MNKLLFGTAGIPASTLQPSTLSGIERVKELGLDAMELEFVRSVHVRDDKTSLVKQSAVKNNVALTCHGQYYINLNAKEKEKLEASKERMFKAASIASKCNAYSVCFHAGYYLKDDKSLVYPRVRDSFREVVARIKDSGLKIWIRPELMGRNSQFGDLDEVIKLSQDVENVLPCIDFGHLHARDGKYNSYSEWREAFAKLEKELGKNVLDNMHIHIEGIEYGKAGEIRHLNLNDSDLKYTELLKVWKEFNIKGVVICESPNIEQDAMMLKEIYSQFPHIA